MRLISKALVLSLSVLLATSTAFALNLAHIKTAKYTAAKLNTYAYELPGTFSFNPPGMIEFATVHDSSGAVLAVCKVAVQNAAVTGFAASEATANMGIAPNTFFFDNLYYLQCPIPVSLQTGLPPAESHQILLVRTVATSQVRYLLGSQSGVGPIAWTDEL